MKSIFFSHQNASLFILSWTLTCFSYMIKILNVISPNLKLLFGSHCRCARVPDVNTAPFHQRRGRFLKPSWFPWATPMFEITFTYQDVCNCHQVKYSFWVECNCGDLGNWYLPHWCHMITCSHVAFAGNATQQIACKRNARMQEFACNKQQPKLSRCITQLFNETIEVLYDTLFYFPFTGCGYLFWQNFLKLAFHCIVWK